MNSSTVSLALAPRNDAAALSTEHAARHSSAQALILTRAKYTERRTSPAGFPMRNRCQADRCTVQVSP